MPTKFGRKANRDFQHFAKVLGVRHNFGRKLVNSIDKASTIASRVADVAAVVNPELAPAAMSMKGMAGEWNGLAQSGIGLTGSRPDYDALKQQVENTKQYAKELKAARDALQRKKPAVMPDSNTDENGVQFAD